MILARFNGSKISKPRVEKGAQPFGQRVVWRKRKSSGEKGKERERKRRGWLHGLLCSHNLNTDTKTGSGKEDGKGFRTSKGHGTAAVASEERRRRFLLGRVANAIYRQYFIAQRFTDYTQLTKSILGRWLCTVIKGRMID